MLVFRKMLRTYLMDDPFLKFSKHILQVITFLPKKMILPLSLSSSSLFIDASISDFLFAL